MARMSEKDFERLAAKSKGSDPKAQESLFGKVTTAALTSHAIWALSMKGYDAWRNNSVGIWDPQKQVFRKNKSAKLGVSDVIGFHRRTGQFVACEIKNGKDRLSDDQEYFLEEVQRAGGLAMVIRSIDDIENYMRHGTIRIQ